MMIPQHAKWLYIVSLLLVDIASSMNSNISEFSIINDVYDNLPHERCDVISISSKLLKGERFEVNQFKGSIVIVTHISVDVGRSSINFDELREFYSAMDLEKIARMISTMTCFIAHVEADSFIEAVAFLDFINGLHGNIVNNRKKHLVLMTPTATIDYGLIKNKTNMFGVHFISQNSAGKYFGVHLCISFFG